SLLEIRRLARTLSGLRPFGIAAQYAQKVRQFPQVVERILRVGRIRAAQEIEIEKIFPRFSPQRVRLDLDQIQVAEGKSAQGAEQRPRNVARAEHQRGFPGGAPVNPDRM